MLAPLVAPRSISSPVRLLPPARDPRRSEALVRRVVPATAPQRLVDILVRCLGELRHGRVSAPAPAPAADWEADLVLEACELAARTLDAARKMLAARSVLDWVDGGTPDHGGSEDAPRWRGQGNDDGDDDDAEEIVVHLMGLCELRGWLVARRGEQGGERR